MSTLTNPYTAGDPVGKTAFFVGREDVLREVERLLRHPTQNAMTLFGQRRIGKTSILQYLEAHLPEAGPYLPIYFDLMHKAGLPLAEILRDLARSIAWQLNLPDDGLEKTTEKTFRDSYLPGVLRALPAQASLVLLLDEFDVLADPQAEQQSKRQFFSYLRDLRQLDPQRLQFIFVLGRNVDDLDVVAQGLFKDLPSKRVSLLEQKDAEALVRLSERQGSLSWTAEAVTRIWELASGHPYLTQALCSQIWEDAHQESEQPAPAQPADVENAVAGALERSQNMFAWLWDGLGPAEKVVAAALAGVGPTVVDEDRLGSILAESGVRILIGELQDAPKVLQKWDILAPVDGGHRFRVELLRRWIAENKPLSRTQDELDRINPVANSLFNAASGFYQGNNLEGAEPLLRQALGLNPNHLRANELLAEILLGKDSLDEAQTLLEHLEEIVPGKARHRLKQVYRKRAESARTDAEKLEWYEKILTRFPTDSQAQEARNQVYQAAGERALQAGNFDAAMTAFQQAGDTKRYNEVDAFRIQHKIDTEFDEIARLEAAKSYPEAWKRLTDLAKAFPNERNWYPALERLRAKTQLDEKYKLALGALQQGDRAQAKTLLAEVIALDPDYEQATRYLHMAVTGDDPQVFKEALALEKAKTASNASVGTAAPVVEEKTGFDVVIKEHGPRKIDVIKIIRQLTSLGLGEAKTLAETPGGKVLSSIGKETAMDAKKKLEEAGAAVAVFGIDCPVVEEKTGFDVVIKEHGPRKIDVIKVIRQLTSLGLGEAKTLAETPGGEVLSSVGQKTAMDAKKILEEAGAIITIVSTDSPVVEGKTEFDVVIKEHGPRKIDVLKVIRQLTSLGLGEAMNLAETPGGKVLSSVDKETAMDAKKKLEEAGAVITVPGTAEPVPVVEEKMGFDVIIKEHGRWKIDVIKVIRQLTSLGLGEAKTLAETPGGKVLSAVGREAAMDAKRKLEKVGAVITVE
jgi:ribosomal protein L7/L12